MSSLLVKVGRDVQISNPYLLVQALMQAPHTSIPKDTTLAVVVSSRKTDTDGLSSGYKVSCYRDRNLLGSFDLEDSSGQHSARRASSSMPAKATARASSSRSVSKPPPKTGGQTEFRFGPLIYETRRTDTKHTSSARQNSEWVKYSQDGKVRSVVKMDIQSTREWLLDDWEQQASGRAHNDDWTDIGPVGQAMGMFYGIMSGSDQNLEPLFTGSHSSRRVIEDVGSDAEREHAWNKRIASDAKKERDSEKAKQRQDEEKRRKKAKEEEEEKRRKKEKEEEEDRLRIEAEEAKRQETRRKRKAEEKKQKEEDKQRKEEERKVRDEEKRQRKEQRRVERERRAVVRKEREERWEERRERGCDCDQCEREFSRRGEAAKPAETAQKSDDEGKPDNGWDSPPSDNDNKAVVTVEKEKEKERVREKEKEKEKEDEAAKRARRRAKSKDSMSIKTRWTDDAKDEKRKKKEDKDKDE